MLSVPAAGRLASGLAARLAHPYSLEDLVDLKVADQSKARVTGAGSQLPMAHSGFAVAIVP